MELPKTMELPKNIVQIGKPDPTHKIFVEDYVISYMKQWNKHGKRDTGIVLFGKKMTEGDCRYYFVYGASYLPGVEARMQYMTDDEKEEAEEIRMKHFAEYEFLGWGELRGELPEGFYMYEQNKGVWVKGYACFFEKNDSMLSFMVTEGTRKIETQTPVVHKNITGPTVRENNIDARMEERNRKLEQLRMNQNLQPEKSIPRLVAKEGQNRAWKNAVMAMALVVCVVAGLVLTDEEKRKTLEAMVGNVVSTATKEAAKLKESQVEMLKAGEDIPKESMPGEEMQKDAMAQSEEDTGVGSTEVETSGAEMAQNETQTSEIVQSTQQEVVSVPETEVTQTSEGEVANVGSADVATQQEVVAKYVSYTIMQGDTLLSICRKECGSEAFLQEVCRLNNIENADDIKIGQIILLPE